MIGIQTELKLANLLKSISDCEKQIEITRQVLAEQDDFEPYTAFKRIDRLTNGYLTHTAIHRFLRENEITVTESDVVNLIKIYDINKDDRLSYTEFLNMVLPRTSVSLRKLCTSRSTYYIAKDEPLPYEAEWALARLLNKEIDCFRKIELLKEDLISRYDWNLMDAFNLIDIDRSGSLNHATLYHFLRRNNITCTDEDIISLLRRIDVQEIGKINYSAFVDNILPNDPYYKSNNIKISNEDKQQQQHEQYTKERSTISVHRKNMSGSFYSPNKNKLNNADYLDYLDETAKRSASKERYTITSSKKSNSQTNFYNTSKSNQAIELDKSINRSATKPMNKLTDQERVSVSEFQTPLKKSVKYESTLSSSLSLQKSKNSKRLMESGMKDNEEENLALCLKEQINHERDLEAIKNEITLRNDFNLFDAFRYFDIDEKGYITRNQFEQGLKYFNVLATTNEIFLLMRKYDTDNDSLLKFTEFCAMISPKSEDYADILAKRKPKYPDYQNIDLVFSWDTKKAFTNLLNSLIENEVKAEILRQKINKKSLFGVFEAFKTLDKYDMGYIKIEEFKELLINHGIYASKNDLMNLVSRYDKNQDGKITYSEFVQEFTPKSPTKLY